MGDGTVDLGSLEFSGGGLRAGGSDVLILGMHMDESAGTGAQDGSWGLSYTFTGRG